jgi:hypothetical protein
LCAARDLIAQLTEGLQASSGSRPFLPFRAWASANQPVGKSERNTHMTTIKTLIALSILGLSTVNATAGTRADGCTKEPQANWMKAEMVEAKAKDAGYVVSKSKVAGTCYEVYATKGEKRFELFYNPMTAELVEEVVK